MIINTQAFDEANIFQPWVEEDFDTDFQIIDKYLQENQKSDPDQDIEDLYQKFPQTDLLDKIFCLKCAYFGFV